MSLATKLILGGIFAVVLAICIIGGVLAVISADDSGSIDVNLGDDTFTIDAESNADVIADSGPFLLGDVSGGGRPILLQHQGDDPERGWTAILAIAPDTQSCIVNWDADDEQFRDCEGTTYPPDGEGLTGYETSVTDGDVTVDLRVEV